MPILHFKRLNLIQLPGSESGSSWGMGPPLEKIESYFLDQWYHALIWIELHFTDSHLSN